MTEANTTIGPAHRHGSPETGLHYGEHGRTHRHRKGWLHRLENGQRADPDPVRLANMAEALDIDPVAVDRASQNHLAESMPTMRTYFSSKEKLSPAALDEIERPWPRSVPGTPAQGHIGVASRKRARHDRR